MVLLISTFNLIFLHDQKMMCPYLAQAKELPLASPCHPPSPQMTWYAKNLPQHLIMGMYTHIILTSLSVCLLCEPEILVAHKLYWMRTNIQWYATSTYRFQKRSAYILHHKTKNSPRKQSMCMHILSVHTYIRLKMGW